MRHLDVLKDAGAALVRVEMIESRRAGALRAGLRPPGISIVGMHGCVSTCGGASFGQMESQWRQILSGAWASWLRDQLRSEKQSSLQPLAADHGDSYSFNGFNGEYGLAESRF